MTGTCAIIAAAGRGRRFGSETNKVFVEVLGKPILAHTLLAFERCASIDSIVLVTGADELHQAEVVAKSAGIDKLMAVVAGGDCRQDSVLCGIKAVDPATDLIAVHDGARPLIPEATIEATIEAARESGAAVAAVPVIDTIKQADSKQYIAATLDRDVIWSIQTPQTFDKSLLLTAYKRAEEEGYTATDDAALVEKLGHRVKLVMGSYDNIKVTTPLDLQIVEAKLAGAEFSTTSSNCRDIRTGFGYDIHQFEEGRKLFLGGVEFPGEVGLKGHSDADVILHAIADAILGAAALGDIGRHFPDTDPAYQGTSSLHLLSKVMEIVANDGWKVLNVDATLVAERPKIAKRVPEMQQRIAHALSVDVSRVSIKASTAEKLGSVGAGQGAACYAVATIEAH